MITTVVSTPHAPTASSSTADKKPSSGVRAGATDTSSSTPDAVIHGMSVEHGHVDVSAVSHKFRVGERLSVIPDHQGITINHHDEAYAVRKGLIEDVWKVAGRGRVQ